MRLKELREFAPENFKNLPELKVPPGIEFPHAIAFVQTLFDDTLKATGPATYYLRPHLEAINMKYQSFWYR